MNSTQVVTPFVRTDSATKLLPRIRKFLARICAIGNTCFPVICLAPCLLVMLSLVYGADVSASPSHFAVSRHAAQTPKHVAKKRSARKNVITKPTKRTKHALQFRSKPNRRKPKTTRTSVVIKSVSGSGIIPTPPPLVPVDPNISNPPEPPAGAWRPFSDNSPWNTQIVPNPTLAPDSSALIDDLRSSSPYGEHLDINIPGYSVPVFYATSTTAPVEVNCEIGGLGFNSSNGLLATAMIPIPAEAAPDAQADHHIVIVDRTHNTAWDMWNAQHSDAGWTCGVGAAINLDGDGLRPYKATHMATWYQSHGARACGFPLLAGLIRTEEIDAGHIDHALVIAYPHIRAGWYMSPASTAQAHNGTAVKDRGIPCGGRVQLDPNLDIDSLGLSRAGRIVAEALQKYGAYVGDYSGAISLYAENSATAQTHWQGVLDMYEFNNKLDMRALRVLEFGPLTDDGNGG